MAATQLSLYNGALRKLKERKLATLQDNTEARRLLDDAWSGRVESNLEKALWRFARRTMKVTYDTNYTPAFGHKYRFVKPADFVRTIGVWHDDRLSSPLLQYLDEGGYWYSDQPEFYVSFVSNDVNYGGNYALWPKTFEEMVEYDLAYAVCGRLSNSAVDPETILKQLKNAELTAKSNSAMEGPTVVPPTGSWVNARRGRSGRSDLGGRGQLIG